MKKTLSILIVIVLSSAFVTSYGQRKKKKDKEVEEIELMVVDEDMELEIDMIEEDEPAIEIVRDIKFNNRYEVYYNINENYDWFYDKLSSSNNRKYGIVSKKGDVLFPTVLTRTYESGNEIIINIDKLYGLFNLGSLKWDIPMEYQSLTRSNSGFYTARKNGLYGIVDSYNETLLDFKWSSVTTISGIDNYVIVCDNSYPKLYGIYSLIERAMIVPCVYQNIDKISGQNLFKVKLNSVYNIIDMNNKPRFTSWYEEISIPEKTSLYIVKKDNKYGVINDSEEVVVPIEYFELSRYSYSDGSYLAKNKEGKYGFMTLKGEVTLPFEYDGLSNRYNNNLTSLKNGKCGLVRVNSGVPQVIVTCEYDDISNKEKVIITKKEGKYGLLDSYGSTIVNPKYDELDILNVSSGYGKNVIIRAKLKDQYLLLSTTGESIDGQKYKEVSGIINMSKSSYYSTYSNYLRAKVKNGKYKIIDVVGRSVSDPVFDEVLSENENVFIVKNDGKCGLYYLLGRKLVLDCTYEQIIETKDIFIGINGTEMDFFEVKSGKVIMKETDTI